MFFKALFEAAGVGTRFFHRGRRSVCPFFAKIGPEGGRELAAKYVLENAGQAEAGWKVFTEVFSKCATVWSWFFSESFLTES